MFSAAPSDARFYTSPPRILARALAWLDRIDPGTHRRIKGLRLVTSYGIAAMLGAMLGGSHGFLSGAVLGPLAGGFALWASVFEGQSTRATSSRDLALMCIAAVVGATSMIGFSLVLDRSVCPAFQRRHTSSFCSAESPKRFPGFINTTFESSFISDGVASTV